MPNAPTHDLVTYLVTPCVFGLAEYYGFDHITGLLTAGSVLFAGLMFGPDLDTLSTPYNRWGPLKFLWWPYQKALPHRSILSHGPLALLGTVFRIVYFHLIIITLVFSSLSLWRAIQGAPVDFNGQVISVADWLDTLYGSATSIQWIGIFVGLWIGALSHTIADFAGSAWKRSRRPDSGKRRRRSKEKAKKAVPQS
jgi:uncharacterized metal-binding protein